MEQKPLEQMHSEKSKKVNTVVKNPAVTEEYEDESTKLLALSMKNSKVRANRRGELINTRKKTIYELILEEQ
jgi:hypothetical protein